MQFRSGTDKDASALWTLRARSVRHFCQRHYANDLVEQWADLPPPPSFGQLSAQGGCQVALDDACQIAGFGIIDAWTNQITALFVEPYASGKGTGTALIQRLLAMSDREREVRLWASLNSTLFYQRHGFSVAQSYRTRERLGLDMPFLLMRRPAERRTECEALGNTRIQRVLPAST